MLSQSFSGSLNLGLVLGTLNKGMRQEPKVCVLCDHTEQTRLGLDGVTELCGLIRQSFPCFFSFPFFLF
jgi:hypothetical protein